MWHSRPGCAGPDSSGPTTDSEGSRMVSLLQELGQGSLVGMRRAEARLLPPYHTLGRRHAPALRGLRSICAPCGTCGEPVLIQALSSKRQTHGVKAVSPCAVRRRRSLDAQRSCRSGGRGSRKARSGSRRGGYRLRCRLRAARVRGMTTLSGCAGVSRIAFGAVSTP
jgi:hypothetical protein